LSDLRRVLEAPTGQTMFSASKSTIRFIAEAYVDTAELGGRVAPPTPDGGSPQERNERLVGLYDGEFMAGFYLPDCPDFESWLSLQREALHRRVLALLEQLANFHEPVGDYARALHFAMRYLDLEPWDEPAHRRVMRLHALCGQTGAALGQFDACWRILHKELGLAPGVETRQLAERIRNGELRRGSTEALAVPLSSTALRPHPERRQVTVLSCELIPCGTDDPDDAMELLVAPRTHCVETLRRFSGYLVPMPGSGLLAYFGYPQSREDSAVRAVQAALALPRQADARVALRVGVHTGVILTGGDPSVPDIVGTVSGTAIQLHLCAGHNEVAISQDTHAIVAGYFDCSRLGARSLPGAPRPVEVFRVERASGASTRLEAATQLTPLVGRQAELARIAQAWDRARQGVAQVLLVQGEPAIGKSRLVHAFKQSLTGQPHTLREVRCFPQDSQSPLHPLLALLETDLGFAAGDSADMKSRKLVSHVATSCPAGLRDAVPLLAPLFALPQVPGFPSPDGSPTEQRQRTIEVLCAMLKRPTAQLPVVFIVEDLHWADPSTLELLNLLLAPQAGEATLAICTARPGFTAPLGASLLVLTPLARHEMEQLIASVASDLPAAAVRRIAQRADGVPLFAEELAKTAALDDWTHIPGTLQDVLAARMDQLGEAKFIAQLAASLGREFDIDLLHKLAPDRLQTVLRSLGQLKDAGLLEMVGATGCQFRHTLIREAAYQSQTRADRQAAHRQIARVLQSDYPDRVAARPELLAQHLSSAGDVRASIAWWIRAGQRAIRGSANLEAIAHFNGAIRLLMALPAAPDRDQLELSILVGLSPALHATQGYGSDEATRVTARVGALRQALSDSAETFQAEWTRLRNTLATRGPRGVPQAAKQLLELAADDPIGQQAAHYVAAIATFWLGEFEASRVQATQALRLYRPEHHPMMLERFGEDLSVSFAGHLSWSLCFLGFPDQAHAECGRMFKQARAMAHPKTLAMALLFASMQARWLNQYAQTLSLSTEVVAVTRQHGMSHWTGTGVALCAWARTLRGDQEDVAGLQAMADSLRTASPAYTTIHLLGLAEMHMHLKRFDLAQGLLVQAQEAESSTGSCQFGAETHRLRGVCQLGLVPPDAGAAEASFGQALALSRRQGAKTLELRAATSMARLWRQQGKQDQALRLLATTHAWFTEGLDAPDLVEAAELLRALG
jgi:DNA-binding SARP family transcriptional activator/tetratricopeptide (TPR) repeat protein